MTRAAISSAGSLASQHRLPLGHLPLTDDFIRTVVDMILDGIMAR
jgi:hypothetical protein